MDLLRESFGAGHRSDPGRITLKSLG